MVLLALAVLVGLVFGAGDQYLGSLVALGSWTAVASTLSAPWLVVPFALGCTQSRPVRAACVGLLVTLSALAGYVVMTLSPLEGARLTVHGLDAWFRSNTWAVAGGLVTGPTFGFLGQRWRTRRAWLSAVLVAGSLCGEPFFERAAGRTWSVNVAVIEILAGLALAIYFFARRVAYQRRSPTAGGLSAS